MQPSVIVTAQARRYTAHAREKLSLELEVKLCGHHPPTSQRPSYLGLSSYWQHHHPPTDQGTGIANSIAYLITIFLHTFPFFWWPLNFIT